MSRARLTTPLLAAAVLLAGCRAREGAASSAPTSTRYEDLTALFTDWRAFQKPKVVGGVADYTPTAMAEQKRALAGYQQRLAAIDPKGWSVAQQVDYHIVRAEMNGLDFDHRVLQPWANNPAFYVTVFTGESDQPAREGPFALGAVELWSYAWPLSAGSAASIDSGMRAIPPLLQQARGNLKGNGKDLWTYGAKTIRQQSADLAAFSARLTDASTAALKANVDRAKQASDSFATWIETQLPSKTGPSGVGVENYDWYLRNVQLLPYTWRDEVTLMERELSRSRALLAMEEFRNAKLPPQQPVASQEEHARRYGAAVTAYMRFLKERDVVTIKPWMDSVLRVRIGTFSAGPREFFNEVDYRDPTVMRTHIYHWFDQGFMALEPHASPIRRGAVLYNLNNTRTEGFATGWEELAMEAGLFDASPRTRELIYILVAQRAARALGDLRMHANEQTIEDAAAFAAANTPRNYFRLDGNLVRWEQHLYLQQPGYGTSYVIGKIEIDKLIAERMRQLGDRFTLKGFMDELNAAGLIPISLVRWQLTGEKTPELERMLSSDGTRGQD
jgi:hypothetical protein